MSTRCLVNALTVALNCMDTSTNASETWDSLASVSLHRRRTSCSCFVRPRRVETAVGTSDGGGEGEADLRSDESEGR